MRCRVSSASICCSIRSGPNLGIAPSCSARAYSAVCSRPCTTDDWKAEMATASASSPTYSGVAQVIGLPPRLLPALDGQLHHPVALGAIGYPVQVAQIADVPG